MRMRRCRIWARVLALAVLALAALPSAAMADDGGGTGDAANGFVHIGPQMTLIEGDDGKLRVWEDDPAEQAPACESPVGCWFNWVELVAGVAVIAPRNITDGAELPGRQFRVD